MHRKSMKSILVIFAVLGMAAQTHAQTHAQTSYACNDDHWSNQGYLCTNGNSPDPFMNLATVDVGSSEDFIFLCCLYSCINDGVDTAGYSCPTGTDLEYTQYLENEENNFQENCCFTDCETVQGSFTCPHNNFQENSIINYNLVTDQSSFENNCCYTSCLQHTLKCSPGFQYNSAAQIGPPDNVGQVEFDMFCCEEDTTPLTCAGFQNAYNGVQGNQYLQCTGTVGNELGVDVEVYTTTADNTPLRPYLDFTVDKTHEQVQANFNNECCVCDVGATKVAQDGTNFLIYETPSDPPECSSIWIERLKLIKQATDAAGAALTSTCAVAQT